MFSDITWNTIHAPGLRRGPKLNKSIQWELGDRVQAIIDEYPFYKTTYHTMRFADVAQVILNIIENKLTVDYNSRVAISYKFWPSDIIEKK